MRSEVFGQLKTIIERESGIHLTDQKVSLLENRIQKRLRALGIASEDEYLKIIELDVAGEELVNLIDVVSTNVTYFWREEKHFEMLAQILQEYVKAGRQRMRIWCAACSSGEEPYGMVMTALETLGKLPSDFKILATDICGPVLQRAARGAYPDKQLERLPAEMKRKYFMRQDGLWHVRPEVKAPVVFKKLNLAQFPHPLKGPIDIIFCRNVMIYFDRPLRQKIVDEFQRLLGSDGYLFLSHSENLLGIEHRLRSVAVAVHQKGGER